MITEDLTDCSLNIFSNSSYVYIRICVRFYPYLLVLSFSYPASLFRQLHIFLQSTSKSSFRIHCGGLLVVKLIIKDDMNSFLTLVVLIYI